MAIHNSFLPCKLILLVLTLIGCNPTVLTSETTPTSSVPTSKSKSVELATDQCRMHKFALIGEPSNTKTRLMVRGEAEKWTLPNEATMEDIQNVREPVRLVQIQGEFELEGAPPPEAGIQTTDIPPRKGVCWVIIDAKSSEILGLQGKTD